MDVFTVEFLPYIIGLFELFQAVSFSRLQLVLSAKKETNKTNEPFRATIEAYTG